MSTITPPQSGIPLGYVSVAGQRLPVEQSPEFTRMLFDLFRRVGGTTAPTNTDLATDLPEDAGIEELKATVFRNADAADQQPPSVVLPADDDANGRLQSLEAMVAYLRTEIEALKQGMML